MTQKKKKAKPETKKQVPNSQVTKEKVYDTAVLIHNVCIEMRRTLNEAIKDIPVAAQWLVAARVCNRFFYDLYQPQINLMVEQMTSKQGGDANE